MANLYSGAVFALMSSLAFQLPECSFEKTKINNDDGVISQYSPWVVRRDNESPYVMFYCKNSVINGIGRDRVWRMENYGDGIHDWVNDIVVVEGTSKRKEDDLSCSPGVEFMGDTWHMYYLVANRRTPLDIYIHHAVAEYPGYDWKKLGRVTGESVMQNVYMERPSPVFANSMMNLYVQGPDAYWYVARSSDGHDFTERIELNAPPGDGRISMSGGLYFYAFNTFNGWDKRTLFSHEFRVLVSTDGINFTHEISLPNSYAPGDWDSNERYGPFLFVENDRAPVKLYYSGNAEYPKPSFSYPDTKKCCFMQRTSLGVIAYTPVPESHSVGGPR